MNLQWFNDFNSSNVDAFAYEDGRLYVRFLNGSIYEYPADHQDYLDMIDAPSKGKFVWRRLRDTGERRIR